VLYRLSYVGEATKKLFIDSILLIKVERVMGIEPTLSAWKAEVLPLNYTRLVFVLSYKTHIKKGFATH
jgi:hypothetical protein